MDSRASMDGTVVIVQEGRFQLLDLAGAGHMFILGPGAAAETEQLGPLQARQARVRVTYTQAQNAIGLVAEQIVMLE